MHLFNRSPEAQLPHGFARSGNTGPARERIRAGRTRSLGF